MRFFLIVRKLFCTHCTRATPQFEIVSLVIVSSSIDAPAPRARKSKNRQGQFLKFLYCGLGDATAVLSNSSDVLECVFNLEHHHLLFPRLA
jgi:hypothetical protein